MKKQSSLESLLKSKSAQIVIKIVMWILSILGIIFSLFVIFSSSIYGAFMLLASLMILPPIKKIYSPKMHLRLRWILLISFLTFWTGFITYIETDYKPTETTKDSQQATVRIKPEQLEFVSDTPT